MWQIVDVQVHEMHVDIIAKNSKGARTVSLYAGQEPTMAFEMFCKINDSRAVVRDYFLYDYMQYHAEYKDIVDRIGKLIEKIKDPLLFSGELYDELDDLQHHAYELSDKIETHHIILLAIRWVEQHI